MNNICLLTTDTPGHRICIERTIGVDVVLWPCLPDKISRHETVIILGTPILGKEYLDCGPRFLNLHGGNPEKFRGLDSNLWAIYGEQWNDVCVTLHHAVYKVDAGDVVFQSTISLVPWEDIYRETMNICAEFIRLVQDNYYLPRKRYVPGQYMGAMPEELKPICKRKWNERLHKLPR